MFSLFGHRKYVASPTTAEEAPLTDEQIEAEYFPGELPLTPAEPEIDWAESAWRTSEQQWMVRSSDGLEILIAGDPEQPKPDHLATAKLVVTQLAEAKALSIRLLQSFVHEPGAWSFDELNVGTDAEHNRCDFQTALSFSPSDGSDAYGYTSFVVCFRIIKGTHKHRLHPFKTIIEFL